MKGKIVTTLLAAAAGLTIATAIPTVSGSTVQADTIGSVTFTKGWASGVLRNFYGRVPDTTILYGVMINGGAYQGMLTLQNYQKIPDGVYMGNYAGWVYRQ